MAARVARFALATVATLAAALAAACTQDHVLVLDVTADDPAQRLRVKVKGPPLEAAYVEDFDVDPTGMGRDISDPGQAYRLGLRFGAPGRYGVHVMDISAGARPRQAWAGWFEIRGATRAVARLARLPTGTDDDGDGWPETCPPTASPADCVALDCDDSDPSVNPFGVDVCADGIDEDCTGGDRACEDADGDGHDERTDCDDADPSVFPGQHESSTTCDGPNPRCDNGKDDDCVGGDAPCRTDADCDGHWPIGEPGGDDCDDTNPAVNPSQLDACDDVIDQDCDGKADDGCERCDEDGDGEYGEHPERGCTVEPSSRDCDDAERAIHHGATADCGGLEGAPACAARGFCARPPVDEDCDGTANEGCPAPACDQDGDGFAIAACNPPPPAGAVDCDDTDPAIYPGAPDRCGDGTLQNCAIDLPCSSDGDGDGFNAAVDCNDADNGIHPGAVDTCNGVDDDCDGIIDEGNPTVLAGGTLTGATCTFDNDGLCAAAAGRCVCSPTPSDGIMDPASNRNFCPGETPGAPWGPRCFGAAQPQKERCDLPDQDCDGRGDDPTGANLDPMELGRPCHDLPSPCVQGVVIGCDFSQVHAHYTNPNWVCSAEERGPEPETCNASDDDCDGATDEGFMLGAPCDGPDGDLCNEGVLACNGLGGTTCSDVSGTNMELCNGLDDDCDGMVDEGYGVGTPCDGSDGDLCNEGVLVCNGLGTGTVCNDNTVTNTELCNGLDDDCDGMTDEGYVLGMPCDGPDGDLCNEGVTVCNAPGTGTVCSDGTGTNMELCNGMDDDCDGMTDEGFMLGAMCDGPDADLCKEGTIVCTMAGGTTCTDTTANSTETCNAIDDDCDGMVDEGADATCGPLADTCTMGTCRCGTTTCDPTKADNCSMGTCRCGTGMDCKGGKTCVAGSCV